MLIKGKSQKPGGQSTSQKIKSYKSKVAECQKTISALKKEIENHDQTVNGLKSSIVALTEENNYLRGKVTRFSSPEELRNALSQTYNLIEEKFPAAPKNKKDDFDYLTESILQKKEEFNQKVSEDHFLLSTDMTICDNSPKPKVKNSRKKTFFGKKTRSNRLFYHI